MKQNCVKPSISLCQALTKIISTLSSHGCPEVTKDLDLGSITARPIAFGGFGDIYPGTLRTGLKVAVKCARLNTNEIAESQVLKVGKKYIAIGQRLIHFLQLAAKELFAWSKCDHDNVAKLIGLAQFRGQLAMISAWMENGALPEYLRRTPNADRHKLVCRLNNRRPSQT